MTPQQTLRQIRELTETFVGLSFSNEQNFPATHGKFDDICEITVNAAASMSVTLKNVAYGDIYTELERKRCFNIKMLDGALISLRYRFRKGIICEHVLSYFPSPFLEHFQNEPEIYLDDDIYADAIAKNIVPFPVRFDFSDDTDKFIDILHPKSHLTLGQYENCRVPVSSPVTPLAFGGFILRNFYNTAFHSYSEKIPASTLAFHDTITMNERKILHVVCGM